MSVFDGMQIVFCGDFNCVVDKHSGLSCARFQWRTQHSEPGNGAGSSVSLIVCWVLNPMKK